MMARIFTHAGLAAASLLAAFPAFPAQSVYTDFDFRECKTIDEPGPGEEGDFVVSQCAGYKDYMVIFKEFDLRQTTFFGFLDKKIVDEAFESFAPFNHAGKKIEWRIGDDGRPFAAIQRYHVENMNEATGTPDSAHEGQVLVVSRVGQKEHRRGCVVGYVDALANRDANVMARKIADEMASGFACGKDKARFFGIKGEKASEATHYFPELGD